MKETADHQNARNVSDGPPSERTGERPSERPGENATDNQQGAQQDKARPAKRHTSRAKRRDARREREWNDRESFIVGKARQLLLQSDYLNLNMDLVAEATEFSKGLLYKHFSCKEDMMAAISVENIRKRGELFERASMFRGSTRERMTAISVADETLAVRYPEFYQTEHLLNTASINNKCSDLRREQMLTGAVRCMSVLEAIVRDGVAHGDLELDRSLPPNQICFGLWSMSLGAHTLKQCGKPLEKIGIDDPMIVLWANQQRLLDGYGWKPLSRDHDYNRLRQRIREEVFGEEYK